MNTLILITVIASILTDAIGDALNDSQHKLAGHTLASLSILSLLILAYLFTGGWQQGLWLLSSYIAIRFALFDLTYNITHPKLKWSYVGSNSLYDKVMSKWTGQSLLVARAVALAFGVSVILTKL